jgi:hypothetical protein
MAGTMREALEGLDVARFVRDDPGLSRIRTALESQTTPGEAQSACEELVRFMLTKVDGDLAAEFGSELSDLTAVQDQIQTLYDGAVGGDAPGDLATRLRPLQQRRAQLMATLEQLSDPRGMRDRSVDLSEVIAREGEGLPTDDLAEEDRGDIADERKGGRVGARPRASAQRTGDLLEALRPLQDPAHGATFRPVRPNSSGARGQFLLLHDEGGVAAAQGYEVEVTFGGRTIALDDIKLKPNGHFDILEAKYTSPGLESIYAESRGGGGSPEGTLRDELQRQIAFRAAYERCDAIRIITNTESGRVEIGRVLTDMGIDAHAAGITIEVKPL